MSTRSEDERDNDGFKIEHHLVGYDTPVPDDDDVIEVSEVDPVEVEIAHGIAQGMASDGVYPERARDIGRYVAFAIKAYRDEMAKD